MDRQGINVVCCTMSLFDEIHRRNREVFSEYFEVFLDVSMETLRRRDNKNLYGPASRGEVRNVIGVDLPFDPPRAPHLAIDNEEDGADLAAVAASILEKARS
jgi:adenylylsulfate kinase-like enzyme